MTSKAAKISSDVQAQRFSCHVYLLSKVESGWDARRVSSGHPAANLLAELSDVAAGRLQVLQQHGKVSLLLTRVQEHPQTTNLHRHAVQGTLGKLHMDRTTDDVQLANKPVCTRLNTATMLITL